MNLLQRSFGVLAVALFTVTGATPSMAASHGAGARPVATIEKSASYITTPDGVHLYYKDWGPKNGPVVAFSHGWP